MLCRCAICQKFKLSSSTKSAAFDKFITKKHKEAVPNVELTLTKVELLNRKYLP